jgi:2-keto-4-pentenoate hydratase/2-oxohepta-3-ene-1,7-dioic acid hydratase in catechol pathway
MRLVTYLGKGRERVAGVRQGSLVDLHAADSSLPTTMIGLLEEFPGILPRIRDALELGKSFERDSVQILAPVPHPRKVICIGLNYADHAAESGQPIPPEPVSSKVDYEAELVVIVGPGGRYIPRERAMEHVAGYACGHDVSARDWQLQKPGGQWLLGKSFDGFAPFGPELVTADEIDDPGRLRISLRLNGQVMQDSSTRQLIFGIPDLIAHVSSVCTLQPGDVLFTGTPPGVGGARKPPVFLQPGDVAEVEIEQIGLLRNRFVAEAS